MKKINVSILMTVVAIFFFNGMALAGDLGTGGVPVTIEGANSSSTAYIYRDSGDVGTIFLGEFDIDVDGTNFPGYCAELGVNIEGNVTYYGQLETLGPVSPFCEMGYILSNYEASDGFWGGVIQLAIWKLLDPSVYTDHPYMEPYANDIIADAEGNCMLMCGDNVELAVDAQTDGTATVTLTQNGTPFANQKVTLSTSAGTIVSPGAEGYTDDNGELFVTIDLEGAMSYTLNAEVEGLDLVFVHLPDVQDLIYKDGCIFTAEDTVENETTGYGDPRTIGFWKHQARWSCSNGGAHAQVSCEDLTSLLPIEMFGTTVTTVDELYDVLWIKKAPMETRAVQQCTATMLNLNYGELYTNSFVDTDGDGEADSTVAGAFDAADDAYYSGDPETAKTICDTINNL